MNNLLICIKTLNAINFTREDGEAALAFVQTAPLPSLLLLQGTAQMNAVTKSRAARTDITKLCHVNQCFQ